jgi:hypothetical protein
MEVQKTFETYELLTMITHEATDDTGKRALRWRVGLCFVFPEASSRS